MRIFYPSLIKTEFARYGYKHSPLVFHGRAPRLFSNRIDEHSTQYRATRRARSGSIVNQRAKKEEEEGDERFDGGGTVVESPAKSIITRRAMGGGADIKGWRRRFKFAINAGRNDHRVRVTRTRGWIASVSSPFAALYSLYIRISPRIETSYPLHAPLIPCRRSLIRA